MSQKGQRFMNFSGYGLSSNSSKLRIICTEKTLSKVVDITILEEIKEVGDRNLEIFIIHIQIFFVGKWTIIIYVHVASKIEY